MTAGTNWRKDATCGDADPDLFFPIGTTGAALRQIEEAKRIYRSCPARIQCLAWALDHRVGEGVWGGTTPEERRFIGILSRTRTSKEDGNDESYDPAKHGEHGIRAQAAPSKTARILRRPGIGPGAGGTGAVLPENAVRHQRLLTVHDR